MKWLALIISMFFCAGPASAAEEKPITVTMGHEFKIVLDSNPSTGNQWLIAKPLEENFVKLLGSEFKRGRPGAPGAGGAETLTFKALGEGKTRIHLKYARLWERDAAPAATTNFVVVISKSGSAPR
jgi:predicted secreted protein